MYSIFTHHSVQIFTYYDIRVYCFVHCQHQNLPGGKQRLRYTDYSVSSIFTDYSAMYIHKLQCQYIHKLQCKVYCFVHCQHKNLPSGTKGSCRQITGMQITVYPVFSQITVHCIFTQLLCTVYSQILCA